MAAEPSIRVWLIAIGVFLGALAAFAFVLLSTQKIGPNDLGAILYVHTSLKKTHTDKNTKIETVAFAFESKNDSEFYSIKYKINNGDWRYLKLMYLPKKEGNKFEIKEPSFPDDFPTK